MRTHTIRLNQIGPAVYAVTGAVQIARTLTPVQAAAAALREAGHPDTDRLAVTSGDVTIMPVTLGSILRKRPPVQKFRDSANARFATEF